MVDMNCKRHDEYAANSQFITHLVGRILRFVVMMTVVLRKEWLPFTTR